MALLDQPIHSLSDNICLCILNTYHHEGRTGCLVWFREQIRGRYARTHQAAIPSIISVLQRKMDESLLPKLKKAARNVVRAASQRGGPIDRGEFTMAQARAKIAAKMGLSEDGLDEKPWKTEVKRAVEHEMVGLWLCPA